MKLRTRLFLMLLVTSLLSIFIFSAVSAYQFVTFSQDNTYRLNNDKLELVKAEVDGMLDKHFNTLHTIAKQPAVRNFNLENVKGILVDAAKVNSDLMLALDDTEGNQLVKSNDDSLTSVAERDFYKQAISGTESYVSDIILAKTTGKLTVVFSTPVRNMDNNIAGVLQANMQLDQLSEFVTELSEGGSNVYILSRQGTVLAHPNINMSRTRRISAP